MAATIHKLNSNDWASDKPPLIKPMTYRLVYVKHSVAKLHTKGGKVIIWFRIIEPGEAFETILPRYYNAEWVRIKTGEFKAGWKSDLMREYAQYFGAPQRPDRIPLSKFKDGIYKGKIRTVDFARRKPIPKDLQYSVIDSIISKES